MNIRILLLQARQPNDRVREEERRSFAEKARLPIESVVPHDLLGGPPTLAQVKSHDALMVGGSGDYYVSKMNLPHYRETLDLLSEVAEASHPTFASCFGFQLLTAALGGNVIHDPESMEVGTYRLALTDEGQADPLLGSLPASFWAQMGRKDRAEILPRNAIHLASSPQAPFQAFRLRGKPIWTTQFHPELDREENLGRYLRYLDGYVGHMSPEEQDEAKNRFVESPETEALLPRFFDLVFG